MKTKTFNPSEITEQQHATFEREGWAIFNGNEVEKIDEPESWDDDSGFTPPHLKSDMQAKRRAIKHGFVFGDLRHPFTITEVIIKN